MVYGYRLVLKAKIQIDLKTVHHESFDFFPLGLLALTLLVACGDQSTTSTQHTAIHDQMSIEVGHNLVFENDYATVVKVRLAPEDSLKVHQGGKRVIYSLTDYSIEWQEQGEETGSKSWKKGDTHFHEAGEHSAKNIGKTIAEWIVFTKKNADLPACNENTLENDVHAVSDEFATVLLDNDEFKVTEVSIPKGASIPMHSGVNRVIYSLSEYKIAYESGDIGKIERQFKPGDCHWHEACQHAIQNVGETDAEFLVVSYKRKEK